MRGRLASALVVAVVGTAAQPAGAAAESFAAAEACAEHEAFVAGDDAAVASRLPKRYTPVRDENSGRPLVFVRGITCEKLTVEGRTKAATMGTYGIVVETLDGTGCASAAPVAGEVKGDFPPACNLYTLAWVTDRARMARWMREGMPGFPASHATGLSFELGPDGAAFRFRAPGFGIEATNRPERPREIPIRRSYWHESARETVRFRFASETMTAGDADGAVTAEPGTELAALIGGERAEYVRPYNSFAPEHFARGVYRTQRLGPAENTDRFEGSCSFKGLVTFDPPARNEARPGRYAYAAEGTCTGTLNRRALTDAPVRLQQAGTAMVSCLKAHTTSPGEGVLTFPDGTTLEYNLDFTTTGTEVKGEIYGDRSGLATGTGTFATDRTGPEVTAGCAGDGTPTAPLDIDWETKDALVSERPSAPASAGAPQQGEQGGQAPAGSTKAKKRKAKKRKAKCKRKARRRAKGRRAKRRAVRTCSARRPARRRRA